MIVSNSPQILAMADHLDHYNPISTDSTSGNGQFDYSEGRGGCLFLYSLGGINDQMSEVLAPTSHINDNHSYSGNVFGF